MLTLRSPSSRGAWIEMGGGHCRYPAGGVALLAGGVDRNPSRAIMRPLEKVALLAGGVDRNSKAGTQIVRMDSRPPRGGRR